MCLMYWRTPHSWYITDKLQQLILSNSLIRMCGSTVSIACCYITFVRIRVIIYPPCVPILLI